jgi:hypothetical protein
MTVANTDINRIVQELNSANTLSELTEIKSHYGEAAVREAWSTLSEQEKAEITAIAQGKQTEEKSTTKPKQSNSLWGKTRDLLELEDALTNIDLDENLKEEEKEAQRQEIFSQWIESNEDWQQKIEAAGYATKCIDKEVEALKSMVDDLRERQAVKKAESERLKRYLLIAIQQRGLSKVKGKYSTIYQQTRKPIPPSVQPSELPSQYQKVSIEARLSKLKESYKEATKNGEDFQWAYEAKPETNLVIRVK